MRKLKNYREKYESKLDSDSDAIYNGFQDDDVLEYLEIERVIGCKKGSGRKKMSWKEVYLDVME
jgi:chromodomain-helicase-DNA-binding protein 3/chromodomain-helicase-DNA-binding protein 4